MRLVLGLVLICAAVAGTSFRSIDGKYSDPNHPGCVRALDSTSKTEAHVVGVDPAAGQSHCSGSSDQSWGPLDAILNGSHIIVDFSPKGGPKNLSGVFVPLTSKIEWSDGNHWTRLEAKTCSTHSTELCSCQELLDRNIVRSKDDCNSIVAEAACITARCFHF